MVMLDFDMISSPNFARLVYDGDGSVEGNPAGRPVRARSSGCSPTSGIQGLQSEQIPFDGRSDYVGFTNLGIPAGGIFAGAEAPKTPEQEAIYGGAAGEQLDPCYHDYCDRLSSILGSAGRRARRPAQRAKMRGGGAVDAPVLPAMTHAIWHFAKAKGPAADAHSGHAPNDGALEVQVSGSPLGAPAVSAEHRR